MILEAGANDLALVIKVFRSDESNDAVYQKRIEDPSHTVGSCFQSPLIDSVMRLRRKGAATERWRDKSGEPQEHTEWFAVKAFGRKAEVIGEYLHKGSRVYVEGRKRTESWDDKQTGGKHYRDLVYADRVEFLDSNGNGKGNGNGN